MSNTNNTPTEVIEYLVQYFETYNNLPTPVIECQSSGTAYTCFGSNLKGKIERAGGIRQLLETFTSRFSKKKVQKETPVQATIEAKPKRVRPSRSKAAIAARLAEKEAAVTA